MTKLKPYWRDTNPFMKKKSRKNTLNCSKILLKLINFKLNMLKDCCWKNSLMRRDKLGRNGKLMLIGS